MTSVDRRNFIRNSALASGALLAPSLTGLISCASDSTSPNGGAEPRRADRGDGGYGGLTPYAPLGGVISLPAGFSAIAFSRAGDMMSDGAPVPYAHDGMAAYLASGGRFGDDDRSHRDDTEDADDEGDDEGAGLVTLVRNHEVRDFPPNTRPFGANPYDNAGGGTTNLVLRVRRDGEASLVRDVASLTGTHTNCAGGETPQGTWLTCEETVVGPKDEDGNSTGLRHNHGYVFDVPARAGSPVSPIPLKAMGRFEHEALAVDPRTGYVYETEDRTPSGFYRFRPRDRGELHRGGRLEMLAIEGRPGFNTGTGQPRGVQYRVRWVKIDEPDSNAEFLEDGFVFNQGFAKGGAQFARLEGCWYGDRSIYFNATSGGDAGAGQVWQYIPSRDLLRLVFESPSLAVLKSPDNITVSPRGGILICEDGSGVNFLRGLTSDGRIFDFASNTLSE